MIDKHLLLPFDPPFLTHILIHTRHFHILIHIRHFGETGGEITEYRSIFISSKFTQVLDGRGRDELDKFSTIPCRPLDF